MVARKSEYQNQFKSSLIRKQQAIYLENLKFRHQRRDREFLHTPLCWEESTDDEEQSTSDSTEDFRKDSPTEQNQADASKKYQSIAEILDESRKRADALKQQRESDDIPCLEKLSIDAEKENVREKKLSKTAEENLKEHVKDIGDKSISINDIVEEENRKLNEKLAKTYALPKESVISCVTDESGKETDEKVLTIVNDDSNLRKRRFVKKKSKGSKPAQRRIDANRETQCASQRKDESSKGNVQVPQLPLSKRVRRPDRQARIPSAKSSRPESVLSSVDGKPPFLVYGAGDVEENLALHRTHNVRAPADVYCAAVKAKLRREEERRRYREKRELAKNKAALVEKVSPLFTPREKDDLRSEYQKQFHAYDRQEYVRALSAHSFTPRSATIRAVHRGGCVLVHVD